MKETSPENWAIYHSVSEENGTYYRAGADYPSMMKRQITKHENKLQPIFEAITNSFEALTEKKKEIRIRLNFSKTLSKDQRDFNSIMVSDSGHGIMSADLNRMEILFDSSKGFNNFGSGRIQYLHFFEHTDIHTVYKEGGKKIYKKVGYVREVL